MFEYCYNVMIIIIHGLWMLILTIITGKMSKISVYHFNERSHDNSFFDVCNEYYIKTNNPSMVTPKCKKQIIEDYISYLNTCKDFSNVISGIDFPIFDGVDIVGSQGHYPVMKKCLDEHIKNEVILERNY